jgi:two-component system, NarL family, nitrate/nitrite response regulator NarL
LPTLTVFACESQPIVIEGLEKVLRQSGDIELMGSTSSLMEALNGVRDRRPDVMLVDESAGLKMVFQLIADAKNAWPRCQVVLWVNDLAEVDCFRALQVGARGVLKKTLPVKSVLECVRSVAEGNVWIEGSVDQCLPGFERRAAPRLTPREREIVKQICAGLKNKEIAAALSITAGTVKVHLMHIFEKTGVKDRFELAVHGRKLLGLEHAEAEARLEVAS